jgi:hypothetical protein
MNLVQRGAAADDKESIALRPSLFSECRGGFAPLSFCSALPIVALVF